MILSPRKFSKSPPKGFIFLLATSVGIIAANLYYAQPLTGMISYALGLSIGAAGLVVTLTQAGYGFGVLLVVPLGDILENRRLVLTMISVAIIGLLGLAFATEMIPYFIAAFATGLGASTVQIIVPYAAHFVAEEKRGQVVGRLMSGLMLGIMLSRPVASLLTDLFSWHAVFVLSAALMLVLGLFLYYLLPARTPQNLNLRYTELLASMGHLFMTTPLLRRRAIYQACMFGTFSLFWTATPLLLAGSQFSLSQTGIAIFALVGVAGAIVAPYAGKLADRGLTKIATAFAIGACATAFLVSHFFSDGSLTALIALGAAAVLLDAGVTANLVLGQRAIFSLPAELRGRLNGLYIGTIFVGGGTGSALGAWSYANGGWALTSSVGFIVAIAAFVYYLTEPKNI